MKCIKMGLASIVFTFIFPTLLLAADENLLIQQAQEIGIKRCMPAIRFLSNFLIDTGSTSNFKSTWGKDDADKSFFNSSLEVNYPEMTMYADMMVSPTATGECNAVLNRVFYMKKSCLAVSKDPLLSKAEFKQDLNKEIGYFKGEGSQDIYLIPAGGGCIVIKKEMFVDANKLHEPLVPAAGKK